MNHRNDGLIALRERLQTLERRAEELEGLPKCATVSADTIVVLRIILRDERGTTRGIFELHDGGAQLRFHDDEGDPRLLLDVQHRGATVAVLNPVVGDVVWINGLGIHVMEDIPTHVCSHRF